MIIVTTLGVAQGYLFHILQVYRYNPQSIKDEKEQILHAIGGKRNSLSRTEIDILCHCENSQDVSICAKPTRKGREMICQKYNNITLL